MCFLRVQELVDAYFSKILHYQGWLSSTYRLEIEQFIDCYDARRYHQAAGQAAGCSLPARCIGLGCGE